MEKLLKIPGVKVYLVGGALRDELAGCEPSDRDYVVTGATPETMKKLGFEQVGKKFPVYLHPETKDEYALARSEKKTGKGHGGFETDFSPSITIEEDLYRRDLTINAIARDVETGEIVDPHGGEPDFKAGVLRAVSRHFKEDPLRVLRLARFRQKYPGFALDAATVELCRECLREGELDHLAGERVFGELEKSFKQPRPSLFFDTLKEIGCLGEVFPELEHVFVKGGYQKAMAALDSSSKEGASSACQFACLLSLADERAVGNFFGRMGGRAKEKKLALAVSAVTRASGRSKFPAKELYALMAKAGLLREASFTGAALFCLKSCLPGPEGEVFTQLTLECYNKIKETHWRRELAGCENPREKREKVCEGIVGKIQEKLLPK